MIGMIIKNAHLKQQKWKSEYKQFAHVLYYEYVYRHQTLLSLCLIMYIVWIIQWLVIIYLK